MQIHIKMWMPPSAAQLGKTIDMDVSPTITIGELKTAIFKQADVPEIGSYIIIPGGMRLPQEHDYIKLEDLNVKAGDTLGFGLRLRHPNYVAPQTRRRKSNRLSRRNRSRRV